MIKRGLNQDLRSIQADINESGSYSQFINVYDIQDVYPKGIHTVTIRGSEELKKGTYIYVEIIDEEGRPIPIQVVPSGESFEAEFLPLRRFSFEILDETPNGVCTITFIATTEDGEVLKYERKFSINKSLPTKPIIFRGDWTLGEFYESNDVVFVGTDAFICILSHEALEDNKPPNEVYWRAFAGTGEKGEKGDKGEPGDAGEEGEDAKLINIRKIDGNRFQYFLNGDVDPQTLRLRIARQNTTEPVNWYIGEGENEELFSSGTDEIVLDGNADYISHDQRRLTVRVETQDGELEDFGTIYTTMEDSGEILVASTNSNYTFPATVDGVVEGEETYKEGAGFISVFYGNERIPFNPNVDSFNDPQLGNFEFFITGTNTRNIDIDNINIDDRTEEDDGVDGNPNDAKILLTNFRTGSRNANLSLTVGVNYVGGTRAFEKNFTYSKAYDADIVQTVTIDPETQIFVRDDNLEIQPTEGIPVTAVLRNLDVADENIKWFKGDGSGGFSRLQRMEGGELKDVDGENIKIFPSDLDNDYTTFEVRVENNDNRTFTDRLSFAIVDEGADSFTALLDNEFHGVPTDPSGNIVGGGLDTATSKIVIYKGAKDVTANFDFDKSTISTNNSEHFTFIEEDEVRILEMDSDVVIFTFIGNPKPEFQDTYPSEIIKNFTVIKVRQGISGRIGLSLNYRGQFQSGIKYSSTQISSDVVTYNDPNKPDEGSKYYYIEPHEDPTSDGINNYDEETDTYISPPNSPWIQFEEEFESVATDILLARDATIRRTLTIGSSADYDNTDPENPTGIVRSLGAYEVNTDTGEFTGGVIYNQQWIIDDYRTWYEDQENNIREYEPFFELSPEFGVRGWKGSIGGWDMDRNVLESINDKSGIILDSNSRNIKLVGNFNDEQKDVLRISPTEVAPSVVYETGDDDVNYDTRGINGISLDYEVTSDSAESTVLGVSNHKSIYVELTHSNPSDYDFEERVYNDPDNPSDGNNGKDNIRHVTITFSGKTSGGSWEKIDDVEFSTSNNPNTNSTQFLYNTKRYNEVKIENSLSAHNTQIQSDFDNYSSVGFNIFDIKFFVSNTSISLRTDGLFQRDARGVELSLNEIVEGGGSQVLSGSSTWNNLSGKPFTEIGSNLIVNDSEELTTNLSNLSTGLGLTGSSYDGSSVRTFSIDEDIVPRLDQSNVFQGSITAPEGNFETLSLDELEVGVSGQKTGIIYFQSDNAGLPRLRIRGFSMGHNPSIYTQTGGDETLEIGNLGDGRLDVDIGGNITADNLNISNWNTGFNRSVTGLSFSNGLLSIERENDSNVSENLDGRYLLLTGGTVDGSLTIQGSLTVNGGAFEAFTETVNIEDNLGIINSGETGSGITAGFAGWKVDRGSESDFLFGYQESNSAFSVGKDGTTLQAIATREDAPINEGVMYWSDSESKLKTSPNLTFNDNNLILGNQASQSHHAVRADRTLVAGDGLTGLGDLTSNRIVNLGTPSVIEVSGSNSTTTDSHTHSLDLSGRVLTAGNGLTGLGHLGSDRTINMGTPTTITVNGVNETYPQSHRHELDLSDRWLTIIGDDVLALQNSSQHLGNDVEWTLSVETHGEGQRGAIESIFQEIYGDKQFNDRLIIDEEIRGTDYASRLTGFQITRDGNADFRSIYSDELITKSFISDTTLSLAGSQFLTKSMAVNVNTIEFFKKEEKALRAEDGSIILLEDGTQLTKEGYHYTITVEPHSGLGGLSSALVFEEGDFVKFRTKDSSGGGLRIQNIWATVRYPIYGDQSSVVQSDNTQKYRIVLEKPIDGDEISFNAGSVVVDYGTEGDAIIENTVLGDNAPYTRMYRWYDKPWKNEEYEILTTTGNLASVGKGTPSEPEFGSFLRDSLYVEFSDGTSKFGKNADEEGNDGLYFDENNYWLLNKGFKSQIVSDLDFTVSELSTSVEFLEINEGNKVFRQESEPTYRAFDSDNNEIPLEDGDIWIRTESGDHEGKVYIWNDEGEGNWEITESAFRSGFAGLKNTVETDRDRIQARSVLQTNADGKIATVDLLSDSEEGSVITIGGDQINITANDSFSALVGDIGDVEDDLYGDGTTAGLISEVGDIGTDVSNIGSRTVLFTNAEGKISSIELLSGTEGSAINIDADQINITGETTFASGYDPSEKETPQGAQDKANSARDDARNNVATNLGYSNYEDMVTKATNDETIIIGGVIRTSLIQANSVFANVGSFNHSVTVGTSHVLNGSTDEVTFSNGNVTATSTNFTIGSSTSGLVYNTVNGEISLGSDVSLNWSSVDDIPSDIVYDDDIGSIAKLNDIGISELNDTIITDNKIQTGLINANAVFANVGEFSHSVLIGGSGGIRLDGTSKEIYVGTGTYNNSDTPFYVSGSASNAFSLGNKLTWNGSTLGVKGDITAENLDISTDFTLGRTMTLSSNGTITNSDNDFKITSDGFQVNGDGNFQERKSYRLFNNLEDSLVGTISSYYTGYETGSIVIATEVNGWGVDLASFGDDIRLVAGESQSGRVALFAPEGVLITNVETQYALVARGEIVASDFEISSDRRKKSKINSLNVEEVIQLNRKLQPKSFIKNGRFGYGFIAQDIQEISPSLVSEGGDGYLSLRQNDIISLNTSAIQYLDGELTHQKTEVGMLKEKVKKLEKQVIALGGEL